jgi:hypothetical protein
VLDIAEAEAAVKALLAPMRAPGVDYPIHDSTLGAADDPSVLPEDAAPPYLLLSFRWPTETTRLAGWSNDVTGEVTVTHVAATKSELRWALARTRALLMDAPLTLAGRSTAPLRPLDSSGDLVDRDVSPPVLYSTDQYRIFTT